MARMRLELPPRTPTKEWKQEVCAFVGSLDPEDGPVEASIVPKRETPSQRAYGYYHGVIVRAFEAWIKNTGQPVPRGFESYHDWAHAWLKKEKLSIPMVDPKTGELSHVVGSTRDLDVPEMYDFAERCREWLWDEWQVFTPDPDPDWRLNGRGVPAGKAGVA